MSPTVSWCTRLRESTSGCLFSRAGQFSHDYFPWDFFLFFSSNFNRTELETLLSSPRSEDWIRISEMFLGKVRDDFKFIPKHKAHSYWYFIFYFFVILKIYSNVFFSYRTLSKKNGRSRSYWSKVRVIVSSVFLNTIVIGMQPLWWILRLTHFKLFSKWQWICSPPPCSRWSLCPGMTSSSDSSSPLSSPRIGWA